MWNFLSHTKLTKWGSGEIKEFTGTFDDVHPYLPTFTQLAATKQLDRPEHDQIVNKSKDIIVCDHSANWESVPVGMVSKRYQLIQHTDLLRGTIDSLIGIKINAKTLNIRVYLSKYGEFAAFIIDLPDEYNFDPGDGENLRPALFLLNSVEGSFAFRIHLLLIRFICINGMFTGEELDRFKHKHTKGLNQKFLFQNVTKCISSIEKSKSTLRSWIQTIVSNESFTGWLNTILCEAWGVTAAARTFHIAMRGIDIEIDRNDPAEIKASDRNVSDVGNVPGAIAPFTNLYDISQALSWVASNNANINRQMDMQQDIRKLIDILAAV